jgi:hypothetical protein
MADRSRNRTMVCLDYKGYDSQIGMSEYLEISRLLNSHRAESEDYADMWS